MHKLKLSINELTVESFDISTGGQAFGTVRGNEVDEDGSLHQTCQQWDTCQGEYTCNFGGACYTWEGGWTCVQAEGACAPTDKSTCTCPVEEM